LFESAFLHRSTYARSHPFGKHFILRAERGTSSSEIPKFKTGFTKKKKTKETPEKAETRSRKEKFAQDLAKAIFADIRPVPRTEEEIKEAVEMVRMYRLNNLTLARRSKKQFCERIRQRVIAFEQIPEGPLKEAALKSETTAIPRDFIFARKDPPPPGVEIFGEFQIPSPEGLPNIMPKVRLSK
jgi:hypothetical protein